MMTLFFLKPHAKILPSEMILLMDKKIYNITKTQMRALQKLQTGPLGKKEVARLELGHYLVPWTPSSPFENFKQVITAEFKSCQKKKAELCEIKIKKNSTVKWGELSLAFKPGLYYFPNILLPIFPKTSEIRFLCRYDLTEIRDSWIIKELSKENVLHILELGCGNTKRLQTKIKTAFPKLGYRGLDKNAEPSADVLKLDFTKQIPSLKSQTVVIAEESLEHIEEKKVFPLMQRLQRMKAVSCLITMPNKDFNKYLAMDSRHPDHEFEWGKDDLNLWLKEMKSRHKCSVRVVQLGKKISGVGPSWGIHIKFI